MLNIGTFISNIQADSDLSELTFGSVVWSYIFNIFENGVLYSRIAVEKKPSEILLGDVKGSGTINMADIMLFINNTETRSNSKEII